MQPAIRRSIAIWRRWSGPLSWAEWTDGRATPPFQAMRSPGGRGDGSGKETSSSRKILPARSLRQLDRCGNGGSIAAVDAPVRIATDTDLASHIPPPFLDWFGGEKKKKPPRFDVVRIIRRLAHGWNGLMFQKLFIDCRSGHHPDRCASGTIAGLAEPERVTGQSGLHFIRRFAGRDQAAPSPAG